MRKWWEVLANSFALSDNAELYLSLVSLKKKKKEGNNMQFLEISDMIKKLK